MEPMFNDEVRSLFSYNELIILDIVGKNKMKVSEIADSMYGENKPSRVISIISECIKRINIKADTYGLPFKLSFVRENKSRTKTLKLIK